MKPGMFLVAVALALAACGGDADRPVIQVEDEKSVFDPMTQQLEKAQLVEDRVMEHKDAIDKALEDADRPAGRPGTGEN